MMNKICILLMLTVAFFQQNSALGQTKQKAERAFLEELNMVLKKSPSQHWSYNASLMSIDTPFAINPAGVLSVTVRYSMDSSITRVRMEAPVSKIDKVWYDLYLILGYKNDDVVVYESERGSNELIERNKTNLFHIGEPIGDGCKEKEKLQKLLDKLLKYYKN